MTCLESWEAVFREESVNEKCKYFMDLLNIIFPFVLTKKA
jgi:hypothetical protein